MQLQATILILVGTLEEFINLLYYSMCYNKFPYATGFFQIIRVYIWYFVLRTIISNLDNLWFVFFYAFGGFLGDYLSIKFEPYLTQKIKYLHKIFKKKKGRQNKSWYQSQSKKVKK